MPKAVLIVPTHQTARDADKLDVGLLPLKAAWHPRRSHSCWARQYLTIASVPNQMLEPSSLVFRSGARTAITFVPNAINDRDYLR